MSTCKDASGFPGGASAGDMRDAGSIPGLGRSPGGGNATHSLKTEAD